jgi:hypothetical protein
VLGKRLVDPAQELGLGWELAVAGLLIAALLFTPGGGLASARLPVAGRVPRGLPVAGRVPRRLPVAGGALRGVLCGLAVAAGAARP